MSYAGVFAQGRNLTVALLALVATAAGIAALALTQPAERSAPSGTLPASAYGVVSATIGAGDPSFAARPVAGGFATRAEDSAPAARFTRDGVLVGRRWRIGLTRLGYGSRLRPVAPVAPVARRNRVTYAHGPAREWYLNGPAGLEQGVTLAAAPAGARVGLLGLALARVPARGFTYSGVTATDATGRRLPARLQVTGGSFLARVDDRGARYPLTIDPFVKVAEPADATLGNAAVAIQGNTVVVGAPGHTNVPGKAYVFTKAPAEGWDKLTQVATLHASDENGGHQFGYSVAIDGDTIAVGAPGAVPPSGGGHITGEAYVFVKPGTGWHDMTQTAQLFSAVSETDLGLMGASVAVSGDTVAVGYPHSERSCPTTCTNQGGRVLVYEKPQGGWANSFERSELLISNATTDEGLLGTSVAVSSDGANIVAGAPGVNAVYQFTRPGASWPGATTVYATRKLQPPTGNGGLGSSVALDANTAAASAPGSSDSFVFDLVSGNTLATLHGAAPQGVAIDGSLVVTATESGIDAFVEPGGGWTDMAAPTQHFDSGNSEHLAAEAIGVYQGVIVTGGREDLQGPSGAPQPLYVYAPAATTALSCAPSSVTVGAKSTCTVTVTDPTAARTPTGTVALSTGSPGTLGADHCDLAFASPGVGSCSVDYTPAHAGTGTHTITASYGGDFTYAPAQATTDLTIQRVASTLALSCAPGEITIGAASTCTATATAASAPTGTVTLASDKAATFDGCTLAPAGATTATCTAHFRPSAIGAHAISATYAGDDQRTGSTAGAAVKVDAPAAPPPPAGKAPVLRVKVRRRSLKTIIRSKGLLLSVACDVECAAGAKAKLGKTVVGAGKRTLPPSKPTLLRVKLSGKGVRALKRHRSVKLRIAVTAGDSAGQATKTLSVKAR